MREQDEKNLKEELSSNSEQLPTKPGEQGCGEEAKASDEQDVAAAAVQEADLTTDNSQQSKEAQPCDTAQGALGQVKAKVEVCKDESIGGV